MKTPDEIKKGLFCCWEDGCSECPYDDDCMMEANFEQLAKDALAYIQQLESRLTQVERERDAAADDARFGTMCDTCRYNANPPLSHPCTSCGEHYPFWEWRGICSENAKEE